MGEKPYIRESLKSVHKTDVLELSITLLRCYKVLIFVPSSKVWIDFGDKKDKTREKNTNAYLIIRFSAI